MTDLEQAIMIIRQWRDRSGPIQHYYKPEECLECVTSTFLDEMEKKSNGRTIS